MNEDVPHTNPRISLRTTCARVIRAARQQRGLTQVQLAKLTGLHASYVSQVERSVVNISLDNLEKFQRALDLFTPSAEQSLRKILATRLRNARLQSSASQEALAELAQVPVLYISRVERGVVGTSVDQVQSLAIALNIDAESLLK